jgi:hypothetical protein
MGAGLYLSIQSKD